MKFIITTFFLFFGILYVSSCNRCERQGRTDHVFDLPFSIGPTARDYNVGDTITIESIFNEDIWNANYSKAFRVANFNFKIVMSIIDLNSPTPAISYKDPVIITPIGNTIGTNVGNVNYQAIQIEPKYETGKYMFKAFFIVDKPGEYMFIISSDHNGSNLTDVDLTSCPNESIKITFNTNNKQDNNFGMLKGAVDNNYASWSREEFDEVGGYCFEVK